MRAGRWCAAVVLGTVLAAPWAFAQLDIDTEQGPLTLPDEITAAFTLWQDALPQQDLAEPSARIAFAPELLGPETASLTLRWSDGRTEVLLAPNRYQQAPVLLHELGLLLGLSTAAEGVMDPVLTATSPSEPTEADVALLRDVLAFPPADIDRSGRVDFYDLAAVGAAFGSVGVNLDADLNRDGVVNEADLAILRDAYVFAPPARPDVEPDPATPETPEEQGPDTDAGESEAPDDEGERPSNEP